KRLGGKPVYVLTSKQTFSGAEEFCYNLKNLKRATLVGETTGGGAHPVRGQRIDEHFMIGVPFARAINPISKTNWEGTGVEPDVQVAAADALRTAGKMAGEGKAAKQRAARLDLVLCGAGLELAGVVGGVEVALGIGDEALGVELPLLVAADVDAFAGAAGAGVGAGQGPAVDRGAVANFETIHGDNK